MKENQNGNRISISLLESFPCRIYGLLPVLHIWGRVFFCFRDYKASEKKRKKLAHVGMRV